MGSEGGHVCSANSEMSLLTAFNFCVQSDEFKWGKNTVTASGYQGFHMTELLQRSQNTAVVGGHYWLAVFSH